MVPVADSLKHAYTYLLPLSEDAPFHEDDNEGRLQDLERIGEGAKARADCGSAWRMGYRQISIGGQSKNK